MSVSPTPVSLPNECALCGEANAIGASATGADAPCPACGHGLMQTRAVANDLVATIVDTIGLRAEELTPESSFDILGIDSLANLELIMAIEDKFDLKIAPEEAQSCKTIADLLRVLLKHRCEP